MIAKYLQGKKKNVFTAVFGCKRGNYREMRMHLEIKRLDSRIKCLQAEGK